MGSNASPASVRESGDENQGFKHTNVRIPSVTPFWSLDLWRYSPTKTRAPYPVIVMAHGLSANKSMGLATYAKAFASLGCACVLFDYRRWGTSDGKPRHSIFISEQLEDYRTVIKFCRQQAEIDPQHVILWGLNLSGGHVVSLAREKNLNIYAAVAQCPYLGVFVHSPFTFGALKTIGYAVLDVLKQAIGMRPVYIPAVAALGEVGALTAPGTLEGMSKLVEDDIGAYPNEISASSLFELPFYKPNLNTQGISCPLLLVACKRDSIFDFQAAVELARESLEIQLAVFYGEHFDVYPGGRLFEESLAAQIAFLHQRTDA